MRKIKYNYLKIKVSLTESPDKLNRTFLIRDDETLNTLAIAILLGFNSACYHLFEFSTKGIAKKPIKLINFQDKLNFVYDFGDYWEFKIEYLGEETRDENIRIPFCIDATGYGIYEDNKFLLCQYFDGTLEKESEFKFEDFRFVENGEFITRKNFNADLVQINKYINKYFDIIYKNYFKNYHSKKIVN